MSKNKQVIKTDFGKIEIETFIGMWNISIHKKTDTGYLLVTSTWIDNEVKL